MRGGWVSNGPVDFMVIAIRRLKACRAARIGEAEALADLKSIENLANELLEYRSRLLEAIE